MFAKVHPAEDVKSGNTGSCHDLVRYLEKETGEGQRFFSHTEQDISPERVIMDIDGNKKALGANDAKYAPGGRTADTAAPPGPRFR